MNLMIILIFAFAGYVLSRFFHLNLWKIGSCLRRRPQFALLLPLLGLMLFCAACTASWLSAIAAALPSINTLVAAIASFVAALEGKTLSAAFSSKVKQIQADVAGQITNVQTLIADYKAAASAGLLAQIEAVFTGIVSSLNSILTDAGITDTTTLGKLSQLIGLGVAAVQAVIALIPLTASAEDPNADLDDHAVAVLQYSHKLFQNKYKQWCTRTGDADVDYALSTTEAAHPTI